MSKEIDAKRRERLKTAFNELAAEVGTKGTKRKVLFAALEEIRNLKAQMNKLSKKSGTPPSNQLNHSNQSSPSSWSPVLVIEKMSKMLPRAQLRTLLDEYLQTVDYGVIISSMAPNQRILAVSANMSSVQGDIFGAGKPMEPVFSNFSTPCSDRHGDGLPNSKLYCEHCDMATVAITEINGRPHQMDRDDLKSLSWHHVSYFVTVVDYAKLESNRERTMERLQIAVSMLPNNFLAEATPITDIAVAVPQVTAPAEPEACANEPFTMDLTSKYSDFPDLFDGELSPNSSTSALNWDSCMPELPPMAMPTMDSLMPLPSARTLSSTLTFGDDLSGPPTKMRRIY